MSIRITEIKSIKPSHVVATLHLADRREAYRVEIARLLAAAIKCHPKPIKIHTELEPE